MDAERKENLLLKNSGFTLVEIMVALVIFGIISAVFVQQFFQGSKINTEQQATARAQQGLRIARITMNQDLRLAGYDPTRSLQFGFEAASSTKFRITADLNENGVIDDSDLERITYTIAGGQLTKTLYETSATPQTGVLLRQIDPANTQFTYFRIDESTTPPTFTQMADPVPNTEYDDIRIVRVDLAVLEEAGISGTVRRTATTRALCRNMALPR